MRTPLLLVAVAAMGCLTPPPPGADGGAAVDASASDGAAMDGSDVDPGDLGSGDGATTPSHTALWQLPRSPQSDFSMPWPNDLARTAQGRVDLSYVPNTGHNNLVAQYIQQFDQTLDGFSPVGAVYFRFGADLALTSLPVSAAASEDPTAAVQIVDIDPASPDHGHRIPAQWLFRAPSTEYWPGETLAVAPVAGFPLRPHTRYAVVLTTDLRATDGAPFVRDSDLDAVLATPDTTNADPVLRRARGIYAPALAELELAGVLRTRILSLSVFTTQDPTVDFFRAADWLRTQGPVPVLRDLTDPAVSDTYTLLRGHYGPNPIFQAGAYPYDAPGSGDFVLDATGTPVPQTTIDIHFTLTLPPGPMPDHGWPVAIYAHGTGGDADSFVHDGTAAAAAAQHVAMLGFDQIFAGERGGPTINPDVAFFNFTNPHAGRTNNRQAGLDLVQSGRFVRQFTFPLQGASGTTTTVHFDPAHVMFFGHSQGGLNGPLWLAAEDGASAAVLSGAGGSLVLSLMLKTQPVNVPALLTSVLRAETGELGPLHPILTLAQTLADPADPMNYGRFIVREPRPGMHPKSVFQTQGFTDHYAPPPSIAALALSIGLPLAGTVIHPEPAYPLSGLAIEALPLHSNLLGTTGAWMQFNAPFGTDGHFVVFNVPAARLRAAAFLGSAAVDQAGIPTLPDMLP